MLLTAAGVPHGLQGVLSDPHLHQLLGNSDAVAPVCELKFGSH